jgi:predicted component of type VI protein secretion system
MKNYIFNFLAIVALLLLLSACKSTKKGCGLTSDATQIQQTTPLQTNTTVATLN